jgi:drug/metabolite transporter (DMT)-like permease
MQNPATRTESNPIKGILLCLLTYFFVSLMGICKKFISSQVPLPTILFFQSMICLLFITPQLMKTSIAHLKTPYFGTYLVRITTGLGCYATLFYIIKFMPISQALLYQYSASLWIPLIMVIWLNTEMPKNIWFGILIGFVGILIILKPTSQGYGLISVIGILCGILQAVSVVAIRKLSVIEPLLRVLFHYFFVGTVVFGILLIKNWVPLGLSDLIWLLGVGINTYLAQKLFTMSLSYAHASTLAPISYTSIVFSGLLDWIIWHEIPDAMTLFGMLLVILGCIVSIFISQQRTKSILQTVPIPS